MKICFKSKLIVILFNEYRSWTAILETYKEVNNQVQILMMKFKGGGTKFDLANCLIM